MLAILASYCNIGNLYVKYLSLTYHVGEFFVRYLTLAYMTLCQFLGCVTHSLSILAMIVCYCTYTCITIQIVGCLEGWVELVSVYLREVKFIPVTLNQLRQLNVAPIQCNCVLAILAWLLFAILNDACNVYIYYIYVRRYYICKVCITYSLSALAQLEGLRTLRQCILILAVSISSSGYGCLAGQVVDNLSGY